MKPFNEEKAEKDSAMNVGDWGYHGDVFFERIDPVSDFDKLDACKEPVLAYGEQSGHLHKLIGGEFALKECPKTKTKFLRVVKGPVLLKHQEHKVESFLPGDYKIGIQREYSPFDELIRNVQD